jgi:uncharacterized protein
MAVTIKPGYRAPVIGVAAAALLVGSFLLGTTQARSSATGAAARAAALTQPSGDGKITVTGTGTVTGTPNQLVLSMGVQINSSSVSSALAQANRATNRVIAALKSGGVTAANIATSDLSIQPNYRGSGQVPIGYGVSEQLTATLTNLSKAGSQIQAAVSAGGNTTTVDGVSLNLTDTSGLLARARAAAVRDAQAKATQFASALHESVTGVISVSDQTSTTTPYPEFSASGVAKSASVPVSPGSQQVSVQITIVYAVG